MSENACVLIVDDEPQIRKFLRISLASQGYRVVEAATGGEGITQAALARPDLIVLDLGLPDMDGQQVLEEVRAWAEVPVIVLSVRASEAQKVQALDAGANDYVTKPFGIQELLARIRALLRRKVAEEGAQAVVTVGPLRIDAAARRVSLEGEEVLLTRKEYAVLWQLARYPGRLITQQQLLTDIWGPSHGDKSHYLRIVIGHLRRKLNDAAAAPRFILTEPGVGYRLAEA
ncbi:response regulator [Pseudomonas sp. RIT-PI-S]|uniref:response regulator n=1 Tax=Pseudomonas sp. RIT-PI-S TaxID=3035295 RepID=UPI0021D8DE8D|nr:response regulator [Pseudomonas sp. RIT-PI-S]